MGATKLRAEVEKIIKNADERLLEMMYAMATAYTKNSIVAYSTEGNALTKEDYIKQIKKGEADVTAERTLTTDELKKRTQSWKKG